MNARNFAIIALTAFLGLVGCKKAHYNTPTPDCQQLQAGITGNGIEEVRAVINAFIASLPIQNYTEENVNNLIAAINKKCGTRVSLVCFDCIQTLPSQTEIRIGYMSINGAVEKTIDISYEGNNKMLFLNMHE